MAKNKQVSILNHADIQLILQMMRLHFVTQNQFTDFRSDIMDKLDIIIKNTTTTNDELIITQPRVTNHRTRLEKIEEHLSLPTLSV